MIDKFGVTDGCPACQKLGQKQKIQQGHNFNCHERIFQKIVDTYGKQRARQIKIKEEDWKLGFDS